MASKKTATKARKVSTKTTKTKGKVKAQSVSTGFAGRKHSEATKKKIGESRRATADRLRKEAKRAARASSSSRR